MFPKIVVPQNGWFIMENPAIKMDDLGVPLFSEASIYESGEICSQWSLCIQGPQRSGVSAPKFRTHPNHHCICTRTIPLDTMKLAIYIYMFWNCISKTNALYTKVPIFIYKISIQPTTGPLWWLTGHSRGITYHRSRAHLVPKQRSKELDLGIFPKEIHGESHGRMGILVLGPFFVWEICREFLRGIFWGIYGNHKGI